MLSRGFKVEPKMDASRKLQNQEWGLRLYNMTCLNAAQARSIDELPGVATSARWLEGAHCRPVRIGVLRITGIGLRLGHSRTRLTTTCLRFKLFRPPRLISSVVRFLSSFLQAVIQV